MEVSTQELIQILMVSFNISSEESDALKAAAYAELMKRIQAE